jgi:hypothetical protein
MTEQLVYVSLPYATYGIIVKDGKVIDTAPLARWMIGQSTKKVRKWLDSKGAKYTVVPPLT